MISQKVIVVFNIEDTVWVVFVNGRPLVSRQTNLIKNAVTEIYIVVSKSA